MDAFYFSSLLKWKCIAINRTDILEEEQDFKSLALIPPLIPQMSYEKPAITVFYQLSLLLENEQEDSFEEVKEGILKQIEAFSNNEQKNILTWLINFCIKQHYAGIPSSLNKALSLYQFGLNRRIWLEHNILPVDHYKTIFTIGVAVKELDWVAQFIEAYSCYLKAEIKENTFLFQSARLAFERQEYQKAIDFLLQFESNDFYDTINAKILLIRSCYEMQEKHFKYLEKLLESFSKYLQRNALKRPVTNDFKTPALNFVKFMKQLFEADFDATRKQNLLQSISDSTQIIHKAWLLQKAREL